MSKEYTITKDGFIVMQYVGAVQVAGLSETDAATKIGQAMVSEKILPKATVSVQILTSKAGVISYSGAIQNSGTLTPHNGMRLSDIVKMAQPLPTANMHRVRIVTAAGNEFVVDYSDSAGSSDVSNPEVREGDSVFFDSTNAGVATPTPVPPQTSNPQPIQPKPSPQQGGAIPIARYVVVMGAVESPRNVPYTLGLTVTGAIDAAGGLLKNSDTGGVTIQRKVDGQTHTIKENVGDVEKGMAGDMALKPNDIINVPYRRDHGISKTLKIGALVLLGLIILH